jgi:polyisoprenoid-binding protein YceI
MPIEAGTVALGPANTRIEFVGTHTGDRPNPRTGGFERFTGKLQVDPGTKQLQAVSVEIEAATVWTDAGDKLTTHLKTADFFEVREYPTIKFETASITTSAGDAAQYNLTGNLTLHGVTKEISFPATVNVTDDGLTLSAAFTINRLDYEMGVGQGRVVNEVSLSIVVGEKTQPRQAQSRGGRSGGRNRGEGRRGRQG